MDPWLSVLCMRSRDWLAARVSLRLACLPRTASSAQRSRRLRSTRAAAPVLLAHANVTENINILSMGPKLRYPMVLSPSGGRCHFFSFPHCAKAECVQASGLALLRASHSGEIALSGSHRLCSMLAAAPVFFAHTVVKDIENK